MRKLLHHKLFWVGLAVVISLAFLGLYIVVQQSLRFAANEPQNAMAADIARHIEEGSNPEELVVGYVNMATDMAPFTIIYNKFGTVVAGSGYLDGQIPQVPIGVLSAAQGHKTNAVTWEPASNVRIASVSVQAGEFYVLGGRNLSVTESHISTFGQWLAAFWVLTMLLLIMFGLLIRRKNRQPKALVHE